MPLKLARLRCQRPLTRPFDSRLQFVPQRHQSRGREGDWRGSGSQPEPHFPQVRRRMPFPYRQGPLTLSPPKTAKRPKSQRKNVSNAAPAHTILSCHVACSCSPHGRGPCAHVRRLGRARYCVCACSSPAHLQPMLCCLTPVVSFVHCCLLCRLQDNHLDNSAKDQLRQAWKHDASNLHL